MIKKAASLAVGLSIEDWGYSLELMETNDGVRAGLLHVLRGLRLPRSLPSDSLLMMINSYKLIYEWKYNPRRYLYGV